MPRRPRHGTGGIVFHVLNRACRRATLFGTTGDYTAFEELLCHAFEKTPARLLAYCIMPNHWHLVVWPSVDGQLSKLMHWLTLTHTQRWHVVHDSTGTGPLYQGRYKAFPIQTDEHLLSVIRYVEGNPLRAKLVEHAVEWRWSSLAQRCRNCVRVPMAQWPFPPPSDWVNTVEESQPAAELEVIRNAALRSAPVGDDSWVVETAGRLGLTSALRPRGRPRKPEKRGRESFCGRLPY